MRTLTPGYLFPLVSARLDADAHARVFVPPGVGPPRCGCSRQANQNGVVMSDPISFRRESDLPDRSAIFIDGAYLFYLLRDEYSGARIDYEALSKALSQGTELLRTYYYSSLPFQSSPPTQQESALYARTRNFLSGLRMLHRHTIRLGRTERRGFRADGSPIFEQKRVDILLAVDLVKLSADEHIQQAILVAGDSDFIPAIEAAKSEGVIVKLHHGRNPHYELLEEVDEHYRIDQALIDSVRLPPR